MKKCILCLVIDDSENFGDNSNKVFELDTAEGKLFMPLVEVEAPNWTNLKHQVVSTVNALFESVIKEWRENEKNEFNN